MGEYIYNFGVKKFSIVTLKNKQERKKTWSLQSHHKQSKYVTVW